jgi:CRP-like cAMP-binding protein
MALDDDIRALERTPLIGQIGREPLRLLAFSSEARRLVEGETLFERGTVADGAFVVIRGQVRLTRPGGGAGQVVGPGALLGELALLTETVRPTTAVAAVPSLVLAISRTLFGRVLEEYPEIVVAVRAHLVKRLRADQAELTRIRHALLTLDPPPS